MCVHLLNYHILILLLNKSLFCLGFLHASYGACAKVAEQFCEADSQPEIKLWLQYNNHFTHLAILLTLNNYILNLKCI